ncbi:Protein of unknown function [Lactobacillus pasteurii DSM 23907 = CRBIP 24.76]|uniref:Uncharacterized protein n=1 Tax=Lactobacillus pasteurii DSM 23907 = CRBIP 24.76 TaxID=1423790 RepID=I7LEA8_9LACO|nr:Protein of unknown function [Lactobacillus pasteurii DSM 23907 = CRBIP 24.76]
MNCVNASLRLGFASIIFVIILTWFSGFTLILGIFALVWIFCAATLIWSCLIL